MPTPALDWTVPARSRWTCQEWRNCADDRALRGQKITSSGLLGLIPVTPHVASSITCPCIGGGLPAAHDFADAHNENHGCSRRAFASASMTESEGGGRVYRAARFRSNSIAG